MRDYYRDQEREKIARSAGQRIRKKIQSYILMCFSTVNLPILRQNSNLALKDEKVIFFVIATSLIHLVWFPLK